MHAIEHRQPQSQREGRSAPSTLCRGSIGLALRYVPICPAADDSLAPSILATGPPTQYDIISAQSIPEAYQVGRIIFAGLRQVSQSSCRRLPEYLQSLHLTAPC